MSTAWRSLRLRWEALASTYDGLVVLLDPPLPDAEHVRLPPLLHEAVEALPGVALGGVHVDWPRDASQRWPGLEERSTYQPVWADGREGVVVLLEPTGAPGAVVHVRDDGLVLPVAPDVLTWWSELTAWAEETLPRLVADLAPEATDADELAMWLEEAVGQEFDTWLEGNEGVLVPDDTAS